MIKNNSPDDGELFYPIEGLDLVVEFCTHEVAESEQTQSESKTKINRGNNVMKEVQKSLKQSVSIIN
ncbi:MAG: hypothetical protein GAK29_01018 [Acinetobacter bereziniae]|uniref:Uncharacterized protein n=1 Tax=Acinetobacter bereziniae TaxID=106648 RepID=A0A833PJ44_ACIBZ|nr:MAG: hypothetical protein GAK29_01018 [Acinetobacter bereziniae]